MDNKDKIIVSVVIDKQALVDRAFDISKNPSEFNEIKKVIDGKNQFTRDLDEVEDEGKKENNMNLFSNIALDIILSDNPELAITKRLNSLEDKKNSFLAKMKKLDELQEKVKNGEMPDVEGLRELLKVMEEGE
jgi:hypothetical protein|nr:MAG TPA: hypothetical protein [Caudoviricetes sp.]